MIQRLLDGVGSIEISEKLLDALRDRGLRWLTSENDVEPVAMILFDRGQVEITANFIDKVSLLTNSSQLLRQLEAAGIELPPLICQQTISALSNGSPESVGYFAQHAPDDASSDKMLLAAVQNKVYRSQVVQVLLGLRNVGPVCEATVISSLQNHSYALSLLKSFEDLWGTLVLSMDALVTLSPNCTSDEVMFVLNRIERFSVTESLIVATMTYDTFLTEAKVNLLLEYDHTFHIQDELVAKTVAMPNCQKVLKVYLRHGKPLVLTEEVVRAGAHNFDTRVEALETIFQCNSGAKVSRTLVLEALRSRQGAALITLMLEDDPSIAMQEDLLTAAASNPHGGALIFEALHQKDQISVFGSMAGATRAPPAKRRSIFSDPSPSRLDNTEAAAANDDEDERWRLLSLFQTWGVLTEEDRELFHFADQADPLLSMIRSARKATMVTVACSLMRTPLDSQH